MNADVEKAVETIEAEMQTIRQALQARIDGAPRKTISPDLDDAIGRYCGSRFAPSVIGKRVALVVLEPEAGKP